MALDFDGSTAYLAASVAPVTDEDFTMAGWCWADATTGPHTIIALENAGVSANSWSIGLNHSTTKARIFKRDATTDNVADTTTTYSLGAWMHVCGVFSASRSIYLNGGGKTTDATVVNESGPPTAVTIGARRGSTTLRFFDGKIAEVAIWNVALSDADVADLASGAAPDRIRSEALAAYWPLIGRRTNEIDMRGAAVLTATGSPSAYAHPRILRRTRSKIIVPATPRSPTMFMGGNLGKSLYDGLIR